MTRCRYTIIMPHHILTNQVYATTEDVICRQPLILNLFPLFQILKVCSKVEASKIIENYYETLPDILKTRAFGGNLS